MLRIVSSGARCAGAIFFALILVLVAGAAQAQTAEGESAATESAVEADAATDATDAAAQAEAVAKKEKKPPMVADEGTKAKLAADPRFTVPPATLDATAHDLILLNSGEWLQGAPPLLPGTLVLHVH